MKKTKINEVRQLQKIAGILKEGDEQTQWTSQLNQEVNGIEIYNDGDNRLFVIFDKMTGNLHVINDWNGEDFDEVWGSDGDIRPDLLAQIQEVSNLREDKADLETVFQKHAPNLLNSLKLRKRDPEDTNAHNAVKNSLEAIAKELGLDSNIPFMEDEMFSGMHSPSEALNYAKEMFANELDELGL